MTNKITNLDELVSADSEGALKLLTEIFNIKSKSYKQFQILFNVYLVLAVILLILVGFNFIVVVFLLVFAIVFGYLLYTKFKKIKELKEVIEHYN